MPAHWQLPKGLQCSLCNILQKLCCSHTKLPIMGTSKWGPMPQQQKKRIKYTISFLKEHAPRTRHQLQYHKRLIAHLTENGSFAEAPHHRAPDKFTDAVMAKAQETLLSKAEGTFTTATLVAALQSSGVLQPPTDEHNFLKHFKIYLSSQDLTLTVGDTSTIFRITEKTSGERLTWAKNVCELMEDPDVLQQIVFADETIWEESPHPKGECCKLYCWCLKHCRCCG